MNVISLDTSGYSLFIIDNSSYPDMGVGKNLKLHTGIRGLGRVEAEEWNRWGSKKLVSYPQMKITNEGQVSRQADKHLETILQLFFYPRVFK